MSDFSNLTDEELVAAAQAVTAEVQKRSAVKNLEDSVINAIMAAKNMGFTKPQVVAALTRMVSAAYKDVP